MKKWYKIAFISKENTILLNLKGKWTFQNFLEVGNSALDLQWVIVMLMMFIFA
ncbi:MAG: hypothetical protein RSD29_02975 [Bacilli bacterium]